LLKDNSASKTLFITKTTLLSTVDHHMFWPRRSSGRSYAECKRKAVDVYFMKDISSLPIFLFLWLVKVC